MRGMYFRKLLLPFHASPPAGLSPGLKVRQAHADLCDLLLRILGHRDDLDKLLKTQVSFI